MGCSSNKVKRGNFAKEEKEGKKDAKNEHKEEIVLEINEQKNEQKKEEIKNSEKEKNNEKETVKEIVLEKEDNCSKHTEEPEIQMKKIEYEKEGEESQEEEDIPEDLDLNDEENIVYNELMFKINNLTSFEKNPMILYGSPNLLNSNQKTSNDTSNFFPALTSTLDQVIVPSFNSPGSVIFLAFSVPSGILSETDSKIGPNIRHGPHQVAQKSTNVIPLPISPENVSSFACCSAIFFSLGLLIFGKSVL